MKRPDVETLMAYAKGALTPEETRQIERFLDSDAEARRLIEDFRRSRATTRAISRPTVREAPSRHLVGVTGRSSSFTGAGGVAPPSRKARRPMWGIALASSLAVIAGLVFGVFMLGRDKESPVALGRLEESPIALGRLSTIDALSAALTRLASGTPGMEGDRAVTILTTFRDTARRPCREFETSDTSPTASRIVAVACRDGGAWRIEGSAWLTAAGSDSSSASAPASAESANPLAGLLTRLGASAALAQEEEAALIVRNWQEETKE